MSILKTILSATGHHVVRNLGLTAGKAMATAMQTTLDGLINLDEEFKESEKSRGEPPKQEDSPVD